jgi:flagellar motility protein MotE (MotC chaperone)
MNAPLGALIFLVSTILFWKTPVPDARNSAPDKPAFNGPSWEFTSPEADQLMSELRTEKGAVALRRQQLDELASRLAAQRQELAAATAAIRQLQDDFDKSVVRIQEEETPNLKKLAKVYGGMAPASAATVMSQLDDASLVKILYYMKESETGAVLEIMAAKGPAEAKRAAAISERVRLSIPQKKTPAK